jgi:hypothetical protein
MLPLACGTRQICGSVNKRIYVYIRFYFETKKVFTLEKSTGKVVHFSNKKNKIYWKKTDEVI